jgi:hypothetical protein
MMTANLHVDPPPVVGLDIIPHNRRAQRHHHPKESAGTSTENGIMKAIKNGTKMGTEKSGGVRKRKGTVVECLLQARHLQSSKLFL